MILQQDMAENLAAFVAAAFNAIQIVIKFWMHGCRHRDDKELSYWPNYAVHPLYFVCVSFASAALFLPCREVRRGGACTAGRKHAGTCNCGVYPLRREEVRRRGNPATRCTISYQTRTFKYGISASSG